MTQEEKELPEGLKEAAKEYADGIIHIEDALMCKAAFIVGAEWMKAKMMEEAVEFECIGKKVKMTIQELINYYIDQECCDVADECGF